MLRVDILLQDAGGARRGMDFRNDLRGKVSAKLGLVFGQRIIDDAVEGSGQFLGLGADGFRDDGAAACRVLAIVGKRQVPGLEQCHDLARLFFQEFLAHHEDVGDQAGIFAGAVDHLDLGIFVHGKRQVGFIGDGDGNLAADQRRPGVGGGHRHLLDVGNRHAVLRQGIVQKDVAGGAFLIGDLLALEALDVGDRSVGDHGVGGLRNVEQRHDLQRQSGGDEIHRRMRGDVAALQLARRQVPR